MRIVSICMQYEYLYTIARLMVARFRNVSKSISCNIGCVALSIRLLLFNFKLKKSQI